MKLVEIEVGAGPAPVEHVAIEERHAHLVARRPDDEVERLLDTIGEEDGVPPQLGHVRARDEISMPHVVQDLRVHDRVALEHAVVGRGEAVAGEVPDQKLDQHAEHRLLEPKGQARTAMREDV